MNYRKQLEEGFVDAWFALQMDRIVETEGARLAAEYQASRDDPAFALPEDLDRTCQGLIRRALAEEKRRRAMGSLGGFARRVLVAALVAVSLMACWVLANPRQESRPEIRIYEDTYATHTDYYFQEKEPLPDILVITAGWLPEGYVLNDESWSGNSSSKVFYQRPSGHIEVVKTHLLPDSLEPEKLPREDVRVQGYPGEIVTEGDWTSVTWVNEETWIKYWVNADALSVETLLKVAEEIEYEAGRGGRRMDRRERLQARYETARDALLLDRETEGPRQEERKAARRAAGKHRRRNFWKGMGKAVGKTAILVAVLLWILGQMLQFYPEVRVHTINVIIDAWESRFDRPAHLFSLKRDPVPEVKEISLAWIPEGFVLEDEMFAEGAWRWQNYTNTNNAWLFVEKNTPQKLTIDTEDAQVEEIRVQRYQAKLITKDACVTVLWANQDNGRVYCVMAEGVPKEDVLKVAEGFM